MTDYSDARYFAISGAGYGKGHSPKEARENYEKTQAMNFRHIEKAQWREGGEFAPTIYLAPEGATGFVLGMGLHWTDADGNTLREAEVSDQV
jgi:hypothetical protein